MKRHAFTGPATTVAPYVAGTLAIVIMRMWHRHLKIVDSALADFGEEDS